MRKIKPLKQFKKDYRRLRSGVHSKAVDNALAEVLDLLVRDEPLPKHRFDHALKGQWSDYRDCHVRPDLVLIYRKSDDETLELVRLGSHSELGF